MTQRFDYLIVGAGLFGATFARIATDAGKKCLVIDRRTHIGGNCYTEKRDDIDVHLYGPHIFHTDSDTVWNFVRQFARFNDYRHRGRALYRGRFYSLPFSFRTLEEFYGSGSPDELLAKLKSDQVLYSSPQNMHEQALCTVGHRIYEVLIRGYTIKQWGREPQCLPASIIRRLPIRTNYCDDYFDDAYQGIPIDGYTAMISSMLDGIEFELAIDYSRDKEKLNRLARRIVYTGPIDALYDFCYGALEWRYLEFQHTRLPTSEFQNWSIVNYPDSNVAWTRITEHKHFVSHSTDMHYTWISHEYSRGSGFEPAYPIEDEQNRAVHAKYMRLADSDGYVVGGRLGNYRYYDMHQVIASALKAASREVGVGPFHSRPMLMT